MNEPEVLVDLHVELEMNYLRLKDPGKFGRLINESLSYNHS